MSDEQEQQQPSAGSTPTAALRRRPPLAVRPDRPLTKREQLFVAEYLVDLNEGQAAIRAGYKPQNARAQVAAVYKSQRPSGVGSRLQGAPDQDPGHRGRHGSRAFAVGAR